MSNNHDQDRLDNATSARLARLAARPVDTTRLQRRLKQAMAEEADAPSPTLAAVWQRWWRPVTSAAAMILIAASLGWFVLNGGTTPAMAAPTTLAQIHYDVINGLAPHLKVSSVQDANKLLADQANGVIPIPKLPGHMKSCCLHQVEGATLTCALIDRDGQLITVAIADGAKLHSPHGKIMTRSGRQFIAHTANGINMVMAHEGDRWLCVMGEVDFEQLADVAAGIKL